MGYGIDSGLQQYPSSCLTGFGWKSDNYINAIQFQYTKQSDVMSDQSVQSIETTQSFETTKIDADDDGGVIFRLGPLDVGAWLIWAAVAIMLIVCLIMCVLTQVVCKCHRKKKSLSEVTTEFSSSKLIDKKKPKKSFASSMSEYSSIKVSTKTKNHMLRVTNSAPNVNDAILGIKSPPVDSGNDYKFVFEKRGT